MDSWVTNNRPFRFPHPQAAISSKTDEWWYQNDVVKDLKFSDPEYPTEDSVQAMIESERGNVENAELIQAAAQAESYKNKLGAASSRVTRQPRPTPLKTPTEMIIYEGV